MQSPAAEAIRYDAAEPERLRRALADLTLGFARFRLAWALAWLDIRNRYRGSVLGPFWLTLSTGAMVGGLGLLYATLFRFDLRDYLPHLAVSLIMWNMMAAMVTEATNSLITSEAIIRQMPLPYTVHALRCVLRNMIIAAHNVPLILLVFLATWRLPGAEVALLATPRKPRPSAAFYSEIARANELTAGMVAKYVPEAMDEIFPATS